jgi:hypothetical protein
MRWGSSTAAAFDAGTPIVDEKEPTLLNISRNSGL